MIPTTVMTSLRAASLGLAMLTAVAPPAVAQNWEGSHQVRAGAFLQTGPTRFDATNNTTAAIGSGTINATGFGIAAGLEWLRAGAWTLGFEGDLGVNGGAKDIVGARFGAEYFASLRGRVGFYAREDWVLYGTGGFGAEGFKIENNGSTAAGAKVEKTLTGGVFGGGTEWHRGGTIFFAEYLRSNFGHSNAIVNSALGSTTYNVGGHTDAIRVGVKFKLGYDRFHDDIRSERADPLK